MKKTIARIIVAVAALAAASTAHAATVSDNFTAKIVITNDCVINSVTDLDFGSSGLLNSAVEASATIDLRCTENASYNIGLDAGTTSGGTITTRKMTDGNGNTVDYQMFQDSARTVNWGNTVGTDTKSATGTGTDQTHTIYGRVPAQSTPPAGTYTDTVTVTVTY